MNSSLDATVDASTEEREALADRRTAALFEERYAHVTMRNDRLFAWLLGVQWVVGVFVSLWLSPYAWEGRVASVHMHVYAAVILGGLICSLPIALAVTKPGQPLTRYTIASAQVLWSALFIHLTGGRIETHFHIFVSLGILAFYRDLKVLVPATLIVAVDHVARGLYWPESIYGVQNPEWWRFLEHAGWVVFMDVFLIYNCIRSRQELWDSSRQQVELQDSQGQLHRMEKLAAVGQLAASVGHELRNPLGAIRNAQAFVRRKVVKQGGDLAQDPRVAEFMDIIDRELDASNKIISNLLDFSRPKKPVRGPCPLRPLIEESISVVPYANEVHIELDIPEKLAVPELDKDQFRQVFVNLVQNAIEAMPDRSVGKVTIRVRGGGEQAWTIDIVDNGAGIPDDVKLQIFEPLFSTKVKGTGLGLAVVSGLVKDHGGDLRVASEPNQGSTFTIHLPGATSPLAAE